MPQHVDAHGFSLTFSLTGFGDLTDKALKVCITRPDDTAFTKTTAEGKVAVLDAENFTVGVIIEDGDLTQPGYYYYQAFDVTDGAFIPSDKKSFYVSDNLEVE